MLKDFFSPQCVERIKSPSQSVKDQFIRVKSDAAAVAAWTSEKSLLTLSSLYSSISHYCPVIDSPSLIYGGKKMSQWNRLLIKLFKRFWAINPDLYIEVASYFHILVPSIRAAEHDN